MRSNRDLKNILERIDHKGYPAYKDTKGEYQFSNYVLDIEHVQGDPFASPSQLRTGLFVEENRLRNFKKFKTARFW